MHRSIWAHLFQALAWGFAISFALRWLSQAREKPRAADDLHRLKHPISTLMIGLFGLVVVPTLLLPALWFAKGQDALWLMGTGFFFILVSLPLIADYHNARHEVSNEGLSYGRITGKRGYMTWWDVCRVSYTRPAGWFRIESKSGDVAHVSILLSGLPEFAALLLANVSADVIDTSALTMLQTMATGKAPPLLG